MQVADFLEEINKLGFNIYLSKEVNKLSDNLRNELYRINPNLKSYKRIVLIGNGGSDFYENFEFPLNKSLNSIDLFSIKLFQKISDSFLYYPSNEYVFPLLKISEDFNFSSVSPLGLHISSQFGLWFSFRFGFFTNLDFPDSSGFTAQSICVECITKDCIKSCPANAVNEIIFDLNKCLSFKVVDSSICHSRCLARTACPYQKKEIYKSSVLEYFKI